MATRSPPSPSSIVPPYTHFAAKNRQGIQGSYLALAMASVGFGSSVAAVAPASASSAGRSSLRPRRTRLAVPAATRGTPAPAKKEKSILDFIVSAIVKDEQEFIETNPLLNKVDGPAPSAGGTASRKAGGTTSAGKKPAADSEGGGGFNLGGLFAKKG
ncbi:uncharacterized protein LOC123453123 [Hordeum vulgare subsp. vulgare]|nr:uncharacterized protein LOC123453123 [Hordeum vulgare subsp. vulgare]